MAVTRYHIHAALKNRSYMEARLTTRMIHNSFCEAVRLGESEALVLLMDEFENDRLEQEREEGEREEKNIEEFRRRLNVNCTLTDEELRSKIVIDVPMPVSYITKELVEQISLLEPFGKGNTKPVFAQKNLRVLDYSIIGKNKNVVKLKLLDPQGISVEGIYFGEAEDFVNFIREKDSISVTYYPEINRFRGRESLQIIIQNYC